MLKGIVTVTILGIYTIIHCLPAFCILIITPRSFPIWKMPSPVSLHICEDKTLTLYVWDFETEILVVLSGVSINLSHAVHI